MIRLILNAVYIVCFFLKSLFLTPRQKRLAASNPDQAIRSSFAIVTKVLRRIASLSGIRLTVKGLDNIPKDQPSARAKDAVNAVKEILYIGIMMKALTAYDHII